MAIVQISKIQQRRGLQQDLPQLAPGEIGWSIDSRRAYIGNGTLEEGSPIEGRTEIITEVSLINLKAEFNSDVNALQSNVSVLQEDVLALQNGVLVSTAFTLTADTNKTISSMSANNAVITYTLNQGPNNQRTGTIKMSHYLGSTAVSYEDDYSETGTTDLIFSFDANATHANLKYTSSTVTNLEYRVVNV